MFIKMLKLWTAGHRLTPLGLHQSPDDSLHTLLRCDLPVFLEEVRPKKPTVHQQFTFYKPKYPSKSIEIHQNPYILRTSPEFPSWTSSMDFCSPTWSRSPSDPPTQEDLRKILGPRLSLLFAHILTATGGSHLNGVFGCFICRWVDEEQFP